MTTDPVMTPAPVAEEVGRMYDRMTLLAADLAGGDGFNAHLGYWDTPDSALTYDEATDRLTDVMTDRLRIGAGSRLLDLGCGVGAPAVRIARRTGAEVVGISVSGEQVARARQLAAQLPGQVAFEQADAMQLPYDDDSFDAAFALESMPHMPDRPHVLREVRRVLRPGGRVVLTDFFRRPAPSDGARALHETMGSTSARLDDYPALLRAAGLEFVEMLDITDETVPRSFTELAERARALDLPPDDTEARCYFDPQAVIDPALLGYLLVVARRPLA
ncbi:class I SAM-dependent methyltransferase [Streptomyces acidiscabies]|uniref:class I SAM-dependent methyltransferase n=1 Tax=Streptomyces acidiscabies TaxID=42234 RepID=UPI000952909E|nr:class I SAM-dependent methyltransferase [Streptomyces acidiscabies]